MKLKISTALGLPWGIRVGRNDVFTVVFPSFFLRAVLPKEFVGPKSDKLLGPQNSQ
jgi:hypothetical protein